MPPEHSAAPEREAALREILNLISQSREDAAPVYEAILRRAADLCGTDTAALVTGRAGDRVQALAGHLGLSPDSIGIYGRGEVSMDPDISIAARAILTGTTIHIPDMIDTDGYRSGIGHYVSAVHDSGVRSQLFVPLLTPAGGTGCILVIRKEVRPFSAEEIALVEAFAAQAVIAIENVRQFKAIQTANAELETRLAREAATREILEVISQSRDDDAPVFEVVLQNIARLCNTSLATLARVDAGGTHLEYAAHLGIEMKSFDLGKDRWPLDGALQIATSVREARVIHTPDLIDTDLYREGDPVRVRLVDTEGVRSFLTVPLVSATRERIGCIGLYRQEFRPFTPDEIALAETFAAQAVIAIENVRQFRALQERLAREAATREVLEVISQSRDDDQPVFDVVLRNALRLCRANTATIFLGRPEDHRMTMVAWCDRDAAPGEDTGAMIASVNATDLQMDPALHASAQAILSGEVVHILDVSQTEGYLSGEASFRIMVETLGVRTFLSVPLFDARGTLGVLNLHRGEVLGFDEGEIALIQSFAAQAAIAIENVRQFKALEALNAELGDRVQAQVGEIERMGRLKRFLPAAVADAVVSSGSERLLSSHRALLGVLFCDIRGFTAFCETAEPEETIEVLQTYHEEMGRLIATHGAGVDHRMGDGIMVLFNDPLPCDDPAGAAVRLALAMRARMAELCARWKKMGHRLGFGVGIALGYATVGMVGSGGRQDYTASGTAINLASRLCDEAQDGEILLSPRTRAAVEDSHVCETRGEIVLKGIREPVEVFCLTVPAAG